MAPPTPTYSVNEWLDDCQWFSANVLEGYQARRPNQSAAVLAKEFRRKYGPDGHQRYQRFSRAMNFLLQNRHAFDMATLHLKTMAVRPTLLTVLWTWYHDGTRSDDPSVSLVLELLAHADSRIQGQS